MVEEVVVDGSVSCEGEGGAEHERFGDFLSPEVDSERVYERLEDEGGNGVGEVGGGDGCVVVGPVEEEGLGVEPEEGDGECGQEEDEEDGSV